MFSYFHFFVSSEEEKERGRNVPLLREGGGHLSVTAVEMR